jgi:tetratricopeptide (TPR) repeat protein
MAIDTALIRRLADQYNREVDAASPPSRGKSPADMTTDEIVAKLADAGLQMDRTRFLRLAGQQDCIDDMVMDDLFDDIDYDDEDLVPLMRQLWVRWVPDRLHLEEVAEAVSWLELHYPDRNSPAEPAEPAEGGGEGAGAADEAIPSPDPSEAESLVPALDSVLDWLAAGPQTASERFERLDEAGADLGVTFENTIAWLAGTGRKPEEALRLAARLADLTGNSYDRTLYADILADTGKPAEAEAIYGQVIAAEPWNVWHLRNASLLFAGTDDKPPLDAAKTLDYLDRAEKLAVERLRKFRNGEPVDNGPDAAAELEEGFDDEFGEYAPDMEEELLQEVEAVFEERLRLARKLGETAKIHDYEGRLAEIREELGYDEDEDGDEGYDDDGGDGDDDGPPPGVRPTSPLVNTAKDVGRNDPCPCGSGKKYKKCCWAGG